MLAGEPVRGDIPQGRLKQIPPGKDKTPETGGKREGEPVRGDIPPGTHETNTAGYEEKTCGTQGGRGKREGEQLGKAIIGL